MHPSSEPSSVGRYELEIVITAPAQRVWTALTQETDRWWLPGFRMLGAGSVVSLAAEAGGRLIERHPSGAELLWYTAHMVVPGTSLHLVGCTMPEWGGPSTSFLKLALEPRGESTALLVEDAVVGRATEGQLSSLRAGWKELFTDGLGRHVEQGREGSG